tara:strand:- start:8350 stop:9915 length:1566 start_codon:yes stop_codon:yes gene_type:complete
MSGWGKADDKTSTGTVALAAPTATFNGATNVDASIITVTAHPFRNGDKVNYVDGGGTQVVGIVDTTDYFITNATTNTVQLAANQADALHNNPTVITLADGSGASHALTHAFAVGTRGIVTGASSADFAGAGQEVFVGDVITVLTQQMAVLSIESATKLTCENLDRGTALATFTASQYTLSEKPLSIGANANTASADVYGVDKTEIGSGGDNVASVSVAVGGTNYLEAPAVTFSGGGGSSAAATATVATGAVSAIAVTNVGSSYETVPTVAIAKPKRTIPTSAVTHAQTETIAYTAHGLAEADSVTYQDGGGTALAGLVDNTAYFVSGAGFTANAFRLATTAILAAGVELSASTTTNTSGAFALAAADGPLVAGDRVVITGALTGAATATIDNYVAGNVYLVASVTGAAPDNTAFVLTTEGGSALTTTAGTTLGLTLTQYKIIDLTGAGNNAQFFELNGETLATAVAAKGTGATGTSAAHSGWVKRTVGTGQRAGRIQYEVLVAMSKNGITGDAADDLEFSD